jgi:hypothetical protein
MKGHKLLTWCCALVFILVGAAACGSKAKVPAPLQPVVRYEGEYKAWDDGLRAFQEGNYAGADNIFETLARTAQTPEIRRRALFGIAVVKLTMAKTPEEYKEAAAAWDRWNTQARSGLGGEDPRMITPFVLQFASNASRASVPQVEQPPPKAPPSANNTINYRNMLQAKEKEAESLRAKLDAREREVQRLRHQLESLEEIHRQYQEKKQEASTP